MHQTPFHGSAGLASWGKGSSSPLILGTCARAPCSTETSTQGQWLQSPRGWWFQEENGSLCYRRLLFFCCCSVIQSCPTLCGPVDCGMPGSLVSSTTSQSLLKLVSVMPPNHLILCYPLLLLPSIFPSIRVLSNEFVLHIRWAKYWSFSFRISSSNEYSGLISFKNDWFDLPAVQGTLKSLLQHHSLKTSILWHSAFFMVQLSHPYMTPGKTIDLAIQTFVDKVTSLFFNTLSRFVIAFLPKSRSKVSEIWVSWFSDSGLIPSWDQVTLVTQRPLEITRKDWHQEKSARVLLCG